ncbi:P-loop containing nucleoside triphosphate hydrolase protein [Meredithblackwellia eburnea MCA 4105]
MSNGVPFLQGTRSKAASIKGGGILTSPSRLPRHHQPTASTSALGLTVNDEERQEEGGFIRGSSVESDAIDDDGVGRPLTKKRKVKPVIVEEKSKGKGKGKGKQTASKGKKKAPLFVTDLPWPEHFIKLEKTFKALNTVYTFCSARKSMATTYEMLKGGVENLLRRPLEIHDIAQIKSLLPELVTFAYIDSEILRVHSAGADEAAVRRAEKQKELDEAYQMAANGEEDSGEKRGRKEKEIVLLFNFNDGELKAANGVGKVMSRKAARKKAQAAQAANVGLHVPFAESTPKFTAASMTALITKRNEKFSSAVAELIVACEAHQPQQDPVELLLAATEENVPVHPELEDRVEEKRKGLREKKEDLAYYQRNPEMRPSVESLIEELMEQEEYKSQIVEEGHRVVEARQAVVGELEIPLSPELADALFQTSRITTLYSHQAQAINHLGHGKNVIVATSTSSGKSLIYQIPMLKAMENDTAATGLYIFPTKALAQDQKRGLGALLSAMEGLQGCKVATFDGDTPREDRDYIRENANVIFTNPDMLHLTILPREETWRRFFQNLKFVVVDELHTYAGLFGCHVAFVMRRLRRVCAAIGNRRVQFVCCSATISNPIEHMETIFGIKNVELVDVDGSPTGRKEYVIWNPSFIDDHDVKQGRVSTITEASRIFRFLMDRGVRAIVFCKVRMQCEILMKQVRTDLMMEGRSDMASRVMSYRSGYSAEDRRKIEQEMFSGQLLGVIATTALELGIDIGSLDAVITVGFPYTLPGFRQQAGRAGRRNKDSLAMLICDPFPIDQHYANNPASLFDSPYNSVSLDLNNPIVLEAHLQCAADEMPVHPVDDVSFFGEQLSELCESRLIADQEGFFHCHPRYKPYPAKTVPIRNTEDDKYDVVDVSQDHGRPKNVVLEEVEFSRAIFTCYEGAVFMHQGRTFLVKEVDHERKIAKVAQASINWRTRNRDFTNIDPKVALAIRELDGSEYTAFYGSVTITSIVFGYFKTDHRNNILDVVDISSPPFIRESHGTWIDVPKEALDALASKNLHEGASIHAAEHALMSLTPVVAMSMEGDVRTECKQPEKELSAAALAGEGRKRPPRLILYDSSGKSGGVCAKAFDHISVLLRQAAETIAKCECEEGCPSCVAVHTCSGANLIVSKLGALIVLSILSGREIDLDGIPVQEVFSVGKNSAAARAGNSQPTMAVEEMGEEEEAQREMELASLFGGGGY